MMMMIGLYSFDVHFTLSSVEYLLRHRPTFASRMTTRFSCWCRRIASLNLTPPAAATTFLAITTGTTNLIFYKITVTAQLSSAVQQHIPKTKWRSSIYSGPSQATEPWDASPRKQIQDLGLPRVIQTVPGYSKLAGSIL